MKEEDWATLRHALATPDNGSWQVIWELFDAGRHDEHFEWDVALEYAQEHLASWPPYLRSIADWVKTTLHKDLAEGYVSRHMALVTNANLSICDSLALTEQVLQHPILPLHLRRIYFEAVDDSYDGWFEELVALLSVASTPSLEQLGFWGSDTYVALASIEQLAQCQGLAQLRSLELIDIRMPEGALPLLAHATCRDSLRELTLNRNEIWEPDFASFFALAPFPRLQKLELIGDNNLDSQALANASHWTELHTLDLSELSLQHEDLVTLFKGVSLASVEVLKLDCTSNEYGPYITHEELAFLVASPHAKKLHTLEFPGHRLGSLGLRSLVNAPFAPQLKVLGLFGNSIGDDGLDAVCAQSERLSSLETLDVSYNCIKGHHIPHAQTAHFASLKVLSLVSNNIDERGIDALRAIQAPSLELLQLGSNRIRTPGAFALLETIEERPELQVFLTDNPFEQKGFGELQQHPQIDLVGEAQEAYGEERFAVLPSLAEPSSATWDALLKVLVESELFPFSEIDFWQDEIEARLAHWPHALRTAEYNWLLCHSGDSKRAMPLWRFAKYIDVKDEHIDFSDVQTILYSLRYTELTHINLESLQDAGMAISSLRLMAHHPWQWIRLACMPIEGDEFGGMHINAPHIQGLRALELVELRFIGETQQNNMLWFPELPHLEALRIEAVHDLEASHTLYETELPLLRHLVLTKTPWDLSGFAAWKTAQQLHHLSLEATKLADWKVPHLHVCHSLQTLDLSCNELTMEGVSALLEMPWCGQLESLDLRDNRLSEADREVLQNHSVVASIQSVRW